MWGFRGVGEYTREGGGEEMSSAKLCGFEECGKESSRRHVSGRTNKKTLVTWLP
jgi:hypothetical protein